MKFDKSKLDVTRVFLVFVAMVGDIERTAAALLMPIEIVAELAASEEWNKKIQQLTLASQGAGASNTPQELLTNRALNWVQAQRLRQVIDRVLHEIIEMSEGDLMKSCHPPTREGEPGRFSTRALADLAAAMEKAHAMSYLALQDTVKEREPVKDESGNTVKELHASLISVLNSGLVQSKPADLLALESTKVLQIEATVTKVATKI